MLRHHHYIRGYNHNYTIRGCLYMWRRHGSCQFRQYIRQYLKIMVNSWHLSKFKIFTNACDAIPFIAGVASAAKRSRTVCTYGIVMTVVCCSSTFVDV